MIQLFARLILRPLWADRGRTLTTVLSIALGVAVIFAMDLAGEAAAGSFKSSMETVSGQDDIEILTTGGLPADLLGRLTQLPYPLTFSPRIEDYAIVNNKRTIPLIGVGGIASVDDAWARIRAGASLIQIYSALVYEGPGLVRRIVDGLAKRVRAEGMSSIAEAVGSE